MALNGPSMYMSVVHTALPAGALKFHNMAPNGPSMYMSVVHTALPAGDSWAELFFLQYNVEFC